MKKPTNTPEQYAYHDMKDRCLNRNGKDWKSQAPRCVIRINSSEYPRAGKGEPDIHLEAKT